VAPFLLSNPACAIGNLSALWSEATAQWQWKKFPLLFCEQIS
jgi:hypothetical protein